jgi:hypothetical protein
MSIVGIILIIVLVLLLTGGIPAPRWGNGGDRVLYIILIVIAVVWVFREFGWHKHF